MALIYCPDCNNQISEFAKQCPFCGRPVVSSQSKPQSAYNYTPPPVTNSTPPSTPHTGAEQMNVQNTGNELPPKSWVIESILVTCFCCQPLGIVSIIYSTKVESLWYAGNKAEALRASQDAARWTKITFFTGITLIFLYLCFMGVMVYLETIKH